MKCLARCKTRTTPIYSAPRRHPRLIHPSACHAAIDFTPTRYVWRAQTLLCGPVRTQSYSIDSACRSSGGNQSHLGEP